MPKTLSEELTLGQRLARARKEARLSQGELAQRLGVSRQTVSNYERGTTEEPQFEIVAKWGLATDVSLDYFARTLAGSLGGDAPVNREHHLAVIVGGWCDPLPGQVELPLDEAA
jgi:transcriptional regulator with XRE-family HTH domain